MTAGNYKRTPEIREKIRNSLLGNIPWNKGKKRPPFSKEWRENMGKAKRGISFTEEHKKKLSLAHLREKSYAWKDDKAKYTTIHNWVVKWKGSPKKCEHCGTVTAKRYEWANKDHKYKRNLEDYIRLCRKCHEEYDKKLKL